MLTAVLRPQNVFKRVMCLQTAPSRGTHGHTRFFSIHWRKIGRQHFCFKLVNLYLLYEMRNRVLRDCKQVIPLTNICFLLKTFKASCCRNVLHDFCTLVTLPLLRQREYNPQFSGTLESFWWQTGNTMSVILRFECTRFYVSWHVSSLMFMFT